MNLPELPVPVNFHSAIYVGPSTGYTADQMRAYAEEAVKTLEARYQTAGRLASDAEADAADAKRYRWLRARAPWTLISSNAITRLAARLPSEIDTVLKESNEMDAAIDAAIGRQGSGKP